MLLDLCVGLSLAMISYSEEWPTYRADAARSGYTNQRLSSPLHLRWTRKESHAPMPAWPASSRMPYDRAFRGVVADGRLYYGRSTDGTVVAIDAVTGQDLWTFQTDGPVRFAPAAWNGAVFVASDDGWLYCLGAADGQLRWKHRGGPRVDMLLGNDRIISRWPARGGPVVADGVVYFAAGIWPSEGIFVYALDAISGKQLWCNDAAGSVEMDQPHPTAHAKSGLAAQGHLAIAGTVLLVPTGRAVPAALDRADGKFRYFHLQQNGKEGGSEVAAIGNWHFNGATAFDTGTGVAEVMLRIPGLQSVARAPDVQVAHASVAAHPHWIICSTGDRLFAIDRAKPVVTKSSVDRKGKKSATKTLAPPAWMVTLPVSPVQSLIVAGDTVVAGAKDRVLLVDAANGRLIGSHDLQGTAYDLAVAAGRLYVATDAGLRYCFDRSEGRPVEISPEAARFPPPDAAITAAADEILRRSGTTRGYCLDFGCGDGRLALELARRSAFQILAVDHDPAMVQTARRTLQAAGLYGVRVTVHLADATRIPYPNYFADLVVSGRSITEGAGKSLPPEAVRMQRPCGGVACLGRPGEMRTWIRGPLEGAANWTHQYADAGNTLCSNDSWPRSPLAMLWFRDTDLVMPSRHGRGPAPLVVDGRMFIEGLDTLRAQNIYNGTTLWESRLPKGLQAYHQDHLAGVAITGSNLCLGHDRLFLSSIDRCYGFDVKTGSQVSQWQTPPDASGRRGPWGYLASSDQVLFGSVANETHVVKESWRSYLDKLDMTQLLSESRLLFALDASTGAPKWQYPARHSIRHNAIAVGAGRIYFIDRPLAVMDRSGQKASKPAPKQEPGQLVCLDAQTGRVVWQSDADIFGTLLCLSQVHDVLLMAYQTTAFKLDSEVGGRMAAFRASDGKRIWEAAGAYRSRPVIVDRAVYAEPRKRDLLTGEEMDFKFSRSYGCGILAGSQRLLVYRSATLGYYDLTSGSGTENYGGIRPGCWVNAVPAGGLVVLADSASWCTCSYLNQATIALQPAENEQKSKASADPHAP